MEAICLQKYGETGKPRAASRIEKYVRLRGFTGDSYDTKGYVKYDGQTIRVDTYNAWLTEAIAEEIKQGFMGYGGMAGRAVSPRSGGESVLEQLKYLLNTPLLSASDVMKGKAVLYKSKAIYRAEIPVPSMDSL
jgi:hypothetical protein